MRLQIQRSDEQTGSDNRPKMLKEPWFQAEAVPRHPPRAILQYPGRWLEIISILTRSQDWIGLLRAVLFRWNQPLLLGKAPLFLIYWVEVE